MTSDPVSQLLLDLDSKLDMPPAAKDRLLREIEDHLADGVQQLSSPA